MKGSEVSSLSGQEGSPRAGPAGTASPEPGLDQRGQLGESCLTRLASDCFRFGTTVFSRFATGMDRWTGGLYGTPVYRQGVPCCCGMVEPAGQLRERTCWRRGAGPALGRAISQMVAMRLFRTGAVEFVPESTRDDIVRLLGMFLEQLAVSAGLGGRGRGGG